MATSAFIVDDIFRQYVGAAGGRWYGCVQGTQFNSSIRPILAKPYILPIWTGLDVTHSWTTLGIRIRFGGDAGSLVRLGVYELDENNQFKPKTLLLDAGTVAGDVAGAITKAISLTTANIEWLGLALQCENAPTLTAALDQSNSTPHFLPPLFGYTSIADWNTDATQSAWTLAHTGTVTQGALPGAAEFNNFAVISQPFPQMWIRRSTTP